MVLDNHFFYSILRLFVACSHLHVPPLFFPGQSGARKFRITGGEPLVRRGVVGLVRKLAGFPGVKSVGMTTNGLLLGRHLDALALSGLASVSARKEGNFVVLRQPVC